MANDWLSKISLFKTYCLLFSPSLRSTFEHTILVNSIALQRQTITFIRAKPRLKLVYRLVKFVRLKEVISVYAEPIVKFLKSIRKLQYLRTKTENILNQKIISAISDIRANGAAGKT